MRSLNAKRAVREINVSLKGFIGNRLQANIQQWLLSAPQANPGMLERIRLRDRMPRENLVPWYGEFAGKYLTSAVLAWKLTPHPELKQTIDRMTADLAALQSEEGYIGPHPRSERLFGKTVGGHPLWDIWGHYHIMLGLYMWYMETGNQQAWEIIIEAADYIAEAIIGSGRDILEAGDSEKNTAIVHVYVLLYGQTRNARYWEMIQHILNRWQHPDGGDYIRDSLAGIPFYQTRKPRWESLHPIQGIAELYRLTGDEQLSRAFRNIWWSIVKFDRHNTGAFSTNEGACGNPYQEGAIETCCTIAWMALSVDMLHMTKDSIVADELELCALNGMLGAQHPSGRWWTYDTPMHGVKKASAHDIVFQSLQGSPELNCCSVNGPRGLGMFNEWALTSSDSGIVLNYYCPSRIRATLPSGRTCEIQQETDYPVGGDIKLRLELQEPESFEWKLRIPSWSAYTRVEVNGKEVENVAPGSYLTLLRTWQFGDVITLHLDMSLHYWVGENEAQDRVSVYRGPLLLAFDQAYNTMDCEDIPILRGTEQQLEIVSEGSANEPWLLLRRVGEEGKEIYLCDFASAGMKGSRYETWLPAEGFKPFEFTADRPVWTAR